jgi:alkylation response protein AidB-like acyl-CoA dehydrogenase
MASSTLASGVIAHPQAVDWSYLMQELGPRFAARAPAHDAADTFVAENFAELKARDVLAAAVPAELGGGNASYRQLCDMLRVLAHFCGSTALTLSMHTHIVATATWRWRRDPESVERLLRRVVDERLQLVGSGASDWIAPSGTAERHEGGFRVSGQKMFASGIPTGDLFVTQAVYQDPQSGPTALHFALPVKGPGLEPKDTWQVLGMRGTGSQHVAIQDVFVPDAAISLRRPAGQWTPIFHLFASYPLPLIYAVYLGLAEAMRDATLNLVQRRRGDADFATVIGEIENELAAARLAHRDMVQAAEACEEPGAETTNRIMTGRTLVGRAVTRVAEKAMEAVGGSAFYRAAGLERLFRDMQGARFHRPQREMQLRFSGRLALGLDVDD